MRATVRASDRRSRGKSAKKRPWTARRVVRHLHQTRSPPFPDEGSLMRHTNAARLFRACAVLVGLCLMTLAPSERPGAGRAAAPPPRHAPVPRARADGAEIKKRIALDHEHLEALYKHLHANPELSLQEARTAA